VHLVDFIIRIFHDARSSECQMKKILFEHLMVAGLVKKFRSLFFEIRKFIADVLYTVLYQQLCDILLVSLGRRGDTRVQKFGDQNGVRMATVQLASFLDPHRYNNQHIFVDSLVGNCDRTADKFLHYHKHHHHNWHNSPF